MSSGYFHTIMLLEYEKLNPNSKFWPAMDDTMIQMPSFINPQISYLLESELLPDPISSLMKLHPLKPCVGDHCRENGHSWPGKSRPFSD